MTGDLWEVRTLHRGLSLELRGAHSTSVAAHFAALYDGPGFASLGKSRRW